MSVHPIGQRQRRTVRDIVVIGGSAGAFLSLRELLSGLPKDCPAAFFVVLHGPEEEPSQAADLLQYHCALPVRFGEQCQPIEPGTVTIAQRDAHLLLDTHEIHLRRGPRENGFRPSIDSLLRSAVVHQGGRTIGIILSGMLDDGASGARALARVGAPVLIEHPDHARFPDLPLAVAQVVEQALLLTPDALLKTLLRTIGTPGEESPEVPKDVRLELMVSTLEKAYMSTQNKLGKLTPFNCPDCNGVLWEIEDGPLTRYRCHTGHAYTSQILANVQEEAVERTLYDALRAQRGRAQLLRTMASRMHEGPMRSRLERRAEGFDEDSTVIEGLLLGRPA